MHRINERTSISDQTKTISHPRASRNIMLSVVAMLFFAGQFLTVTQSQTIITTPRKSIKLAIEIQPKLLKNGRLVVTGKTNLPDKTELMVILKKSFRDGGWNSKTTVKNNRYISDEFSNQGKKMSNGEYTAQIVLIYAFLQPDSVKSVIGEDFKYLTGPLIKLENDRRVVDTTKTFEIR